MDGVLGAGEWLQPEGLPDCCEVGLVYGIAAQPTDPVRFITVSCSGAVRRHLGICSAVKVRITEMTKKPRPAILADEHILEPVIEPVDRLGWFRILRAARDRRFRGRDEWDYIRELRSLNIVFLTQDGEFVRHVVADQVRHAGIVWLPAEWDVQELAAVVPAACGLLRGYLDDGVHGVHDIVIRVENDGIRTIVNGRERLVWSLDQMKHDIEEYLGKQIFDDE